jgi:hypothetical protein
MVGCFENGNEHSGSTKYGGIPDSEVLKKFCAPCS